MIGKSVQYKDSDDKKIYVVFSYFEEIPGFEAEICILVDFHFYPDITRQLMIWQKLNLFNVVED